MVISGRLQASIGLNLSFIEKRQIESVKSSHARAHLGFQATTRSGGGGSSQKEKIARAMSGAMRHVGGMGTGGALAHHIPSVLLRA